MRIALSALALSVLALCAPAVSAAQAQPPAAPGGDLAGMSSFLSGHSFPTMDTDKDGRISRQEFLDASVRRFEAMDADKDGHVTRDEIRLARDKAREQRERLREAREQRRLERQGQAAPKP